MKYFRYVAVIAVYIALMLCTILVPSMKSPTLASEIIYDIAMLGVAFAVGITMTKFEQGSNNQIFWRDIFVAIVIFVGLRLVKVYIAGLLFKIDQAYLQFFNLGYLISGIILCIALYKSIRLYTLKLKPIHIFAIVISGLAALGSMAALLLSGMLGNNEASIVTVISSAALSLIGVIMIILSVLLIIKTIGGMIQNVLIMIASGFVFLIVHQTMYILDKLHGLANAAISPMTGIPYYLFCICCIISCLMRIDIANKENEAVKSILEE
ncbi:MAG: hypothetical protein HGA95_03640 [Caldiserica bacterium]|nr:hypothetical protein [Caldisericota bacterium]